MNNIQKTLLKLAPLEIQNCDPNLLEEVRQEYAKLTLSMANQVEAAIENLSYALNKEEKYKHLINGVEMEDNLNNIFYSDLEIQSVKEKLSSISIDCDPDIASKQEFLKTMKIIFEITLGKYEGEILYKLLDCTPKFYKALYVVINSHFNNIGGWEINRKLLMEFLSFPLSKQALFLLSQNISMEIIENITGLTGEDVNSLYKEI